MYKILNTLYVFVHFHSLIQLADRVFWLIFLMTAVDTVELCLLFHLWRVGRAARLFLVFDATFFTEMTDEMAYYWFI